MRAGRWGGLVPNQLVLARSLSHDMALAEGGSEQHGEGDERELDAKEEEHEWQRRHRRHSHRNRLKVLRGGGSGMNGKPR
jgi:hypothetical protein